MCIRRDGRLCKHRERKESGVDGMGGERVGVRERKMMTESVSEGRRGREREGEIHSSDGLL